MAIMGLWREVLKVLPLGLAVPVVIGAASVKPEDAASNLSAWAKLLGLHYVPTWLGNPATDRYAIICAVIFALIYWCLIWGIPLLRRNFSKKRVLARHVGNIDNYQVSDTNNNSLSFNFYINVSLPTRARPNKLLHIIQITNPHPGMNLKLSVADTFLAPGNIEIKRGSLPEQAVRCAFVNYGDRPLFGVSVPLNTKWMIAVKTENGFSSGDVIAYTVAASPKVDIGVGENNEEHFYIVNMSHYYVDITLPNDASAYDAKNNKPMSIRLLPPILPMPSAMLPPTLNVAVPFTTPLSEAPLTPKPPDKLA